MLNRQANPINPTLGMDEELTRYINDHLAGSSGALILVDRISSTHDKAEVRNYFIKLADEIRNDRRMLENLLTRIEQTPSAILKLAGGVAARVGGLKLLWEKVQPGELGMFEAFEMLALGIQGKHLLWIVMREIQPWFPEWEDLDFKRLELDAIRQRDEVEEWRIGAALDSFATVARKEIRSRYQVEDSSVPVNF